MRMVQRDDGAAAGEDQPGAARTPPARRGTSARRGCGRGSPRAEALVDRRDVDAGLACDVVSSSERHAGRGAFRAACAPPGRCARPASRAGTSGMRAAGGEDGLAVATVHRAARRRRGRRVAGPQVRPPALASGRPCVPGQRAVQRMRVAAEVVAAAQALRGAVRRAGAQRVARWCRGSGHGRVVSPPCRRRSSWSRSRRGSARGSGYAGPIGRGRPGRAFADFDRADLLSMRRTPCRVDGVGGEHVVERDAFEWRVERAWVLRLERIGATCPLGRGAAALLGIVQPTSTGPVAAADQVRACRHQAVRRMKT